jgi:hypothetical protein
MTSVQPPHPLETLIHRVTGSHAGMQHTTIQGFGWFVESSWDLLHGLEVHETSHLEGLVNAELLMS